MKVLFVFLLVAGPFCVRGQRPVVPLPGPPARELLPGGTLGDGSLRRLAPRFRVGDSSLRRLAPRFSVGDSSLERRAFLSGRTEVRLMRPDRMPCLVADPLLVERMPVDRRRNADRMPNGMAGQGEDGLQKARK